MTAAPLAMSLGIPAASPRPALGRGCRSMPVTVLDFASRARQREIREADPLP